MPTAPSLTRRHRRVILFSICLMDIQLVLVFILAVLTVNLVFVGIYLVLVLKEFRQTIKKTNSVLDDVSQMTDTIANPMMALGGIVSAVTQVVKAIKSVKSVSSIAEDEN